MQGNILTDLMDALRSPFSGRITSGAPVKTPRGYGVVVDASHPFILVELDGDGQRVMFALDVLQVAES